MKLKIYILALAVILILPMISCKSGTEAPFTPEKFEFTLRTATEKNGFDSGFQFAELNDGTVMIVNTDNLSGNIDIPGWLGGKKVTAIGEGAFSDNTAITSVIIPEGIERIAVFAFSGCTALESITIPQSVWNIAPFAFDGTPWLATQTDEFVTAGDSVLIAYNGTSKTPSLPEHIRHLGGAFAGRSDIFHLTLNREVLTVSEAALSQCTELTGIELGLSLVYAGDQAFAGCEKLTALIFPDTLEYLGKLACLNCYELKYTYLGKSLKQIGGNAFEYCQGMRAVFVPETVESLKTSHFTDCMSLCILFYGGSEERFESVASDDTVLSFKKLQKVFNYSGGTDE